MEYLGYAVYLGLCLMAGVIADKKGRSGVGYFLYSVFLSPLLGIIFAVFAKPNQKNLETHELSKGTCKKCPHCAEFIKHEAKVCRFCNRDLLE